MSTGDPKKDFARQGTWMVITTFLSGVCMLAVHVFAPILGEKEYGLFGVLLAMVSLMAIPGLGLQSVFAQQTAAAISSDAKERLIVAVKTLLTWTFFLWFAWALFVFVFQKKFSEGLSITKPMALQDSGQDRTPELGQPDQDRHPKGHRFCNTESFGKLLLENKNKQRPGKPKKKSPG